ncbi:hypothetical protein [Streptomyces tsukubensis]|uniref:hypothetical protein n=1 Tax=Streptomyces tsukubensis TaxID=83656 RepID=UPI00117CF6CE|nr:hypothetical protein [Streptomyces tsukubensis]QFR93410.1 hypothetical protein GBW32_10335 [Streptomyces tsukubensis]
MLYLLYLLHLRRPDVFVLWDKRIALIGTSARQYTANAPGWAEGIARLYLTAYAYPLSSSPNSDGWAAFSACRLAQTYKKGGGPPAVRPRPASRRSAKWPAIRQVAVTGDSTR